MHHHRFPTEQIMSDVSTLSPFPLTNPRRFAPAVLTVGAALLFLFLPGHSIGAQQSGPDTATSGRAWSLRFTSGAFIPTGVQRNSFKLAQLSAAGLSWRFRPTISLNGAFSWARSRMLDASAPGRVDVFTSDLGIEVATRQWSPSAPVSLRLFAGSGGGLRSYNYRTAEVATTNHPAGYLAAGADLGVGRVGMRLEARDYASRFTPSTRDRISETRHDVVISASLHVRKRRSHQP